jgi:aldose 1-epimerase
MLGASLRHRGAEILRRVGDLEAAAAKGSTAGIPLLHPWANRLAGPAYRAAGRDVILDPRSPLLHFDSRSLPMHGVPWPRLAWDVVDASADHVVARLDWSRPELLAVFPFPHALEMDVTLRPDALTIGILLTAGAEGPVPVSFGFHPYLGLPDVPRALWRASLPAMRRLVLDSSGIPTGEETPFMGFDGPLGRAAFDDGFALVPGEASFSLAGGERRITVEFLTGYGFAQVFAPENADFVALEPMTAPTSSLTTGRGLSLVERGGTYRASFRIGVAEG